MTLKVWVDGKIAREHVTDESGRVVIRLPDGEFRAVDSHRAG